MIIEQFVGKQRQISTALPKFVTRKRLAPWLVLLAMSAAHAVPGGPVDPTDTDGDGAPDEIEANLGFDASFKDNDIFGNARLFVMQQYRDFLSRESDAAGTDYWVAKLLPKADSLQAPTNRVSLVQTFLESPEFSGIVAPVARLYFAYFLRIPDHDGLNYWIVRHRGGESLPSISDTFAKSPEFAARYGSLDNAQFVRLVYTNVLARDPDSAGLAYWIGQLEAGMTRGQVMLQFSEAAEYRALITNEVYVTMLYSGMLRRAPDSDGFNSWVNALEAGSSMQELVSLFLTSEEYHNRFLAARSPADVPVVKNTWPPHMASSTSVLDPLMVMFSGPMDPATLNAGTFLLTGPMGRQVTGQVSYTSNTATFVPNARLDPGVLYSATITTGARDLSGTRLANNYNFAFLTQATELPPVVAGCPAPASDAKLKGLAWGATPILRQKSGAVTAIPVVPSPSGRASVTFTQGQGTSTPPNPTIELTVSRCPGVIETNLHPACSIKTNFANFTSITAFSRGVANLDTQDALAGLGCLTQSPTEQQYVNVRWTFPLCPFGEENCGFSIQWGEGAY